MADGGGAGLGSREGNRRKGQMEWAESPGPATGERAREGSNMAVKFEASVNDVLLMDLADA